MINDETLRDAPEQEVLDLIHGISCDAFKECTHVLNVLILRGSKTLLTAILAKGANPNLLSDNEWPPLHTAVEHGNPELVRALLSYGAYVDIQDESGFTPLQLAIDMEADGAWQEGSDPKPIISKILLDSGANPELKNHSGRSARDIAKDYKYLEAISLMPKQGGFPGESS